jgi:hypothetical protein
VGVIVTQLHHLQRGSGANRNIALIEVGTGKVAQIEGAADDGGSFAFLAWAWLIRRFNNIGHVWYTQVSTDREPRVQAWSGALPATMGALMCKGEFDLCVIGHQRTVLVSKMEQMDKNIAVFLSHRWPDWDGITARTVRAVHNKLGCRAAAPQTQKLHR